LDTMAKNFENLMIWQKSIDFAADVYKVTRGFPKEEVYGLTSQIRRAVVSISSNVAEGAGRGTKKEFSHFASIAGGSLNEVESQLHIAFRLGYLKKDSFELLISNAVELGKILNGLQNYLRK